MGISINKLEGFIAPSLLEIDFEERETLASKIISNAKIGNIRDILFSKMLIKTLSKFPYNNEKEVYECFYLEKVNEALDEFEPSETPIGIIRPENKGFFKNNTFVGKGIKLTANPFPNILKNNSVILFNYDIIEPLLYLISNKALFNLPLISISAIGNENYHIKWVKKRVRLPKNPIWALSRIINNKRCGGLKINGMFLPNPELMINERSMKAFIDQSKGVSKMYFIKRYKTLIEASKFYKYACNYGGRVKDDIEKRLDKEEPLNKLVIISKKISDYIKWEKLKEGIDFKIVNNKKVVKCGTVIAQLLERGIEKRLKLSFTSESLKISEKMKKEVLTLSEVNRFEIGDYVMKYRFNPKRRRLNVIISKSPSAWNDYFLTSSFVYKIEKINNKLLIMRG